MKERICDFICNFLSLFSNNKTWSSEQNDNINICTLTGDISSLRFYLHPTLQIWCSGPLHYLIAHINSIFCTFRHRLSRTWVRWRGRPVGFLLYPTVVQINLSSVELCIPLTLTDSLLCGIRLSSNHHHQQQHTTGYNRFQSSIWPVHHILCWLSFVL